MNDLKNRLTSRKLWLAVAAFVTFALTNHWDQAEQVVLVYIGAEGVADAAGRYNQDK